MLLAGLLARGMSRPSQRRSEVGVVGLELKLDDVRLFSGGKCSGGWGTLAGQAAVGPELMEARRGRVGRRHQIGHAWGLGVC